MRNQFSAESLSEARLTSIRSGEAAVSSRRTASYCVQNWPHDDQDAGRHCILHAPHCGTHITTKPVDCVFYTCNMPIHVRVPTEEQLAAWFRLLAEHFPKSFEGFEALIGKVPPNESPGNA